MQGLRNFFNENMINKLLVVNVALFLAIMVIETGMFLFGCSSAYLYDMLSIPANPGRLLFRIWTPITYMFTHFGFWHILGNMLWLYFMGRIFLMQYNNKQALGLYLLGGLAGAALFLLFYNVFPVYATIKDMATCVGASAAVTAIVIAICVAQPDMEIRIFGVFPLSLKWLGIIYVGIDILQISSDNSGGHIAHLGGAIIGFVFAMMMRKGTDITNWINNIIDRIVSLLPSKGQRKSNMRVSYKNTNYRDVQTHEETSARNMSDGDYNQQKKADQARIDEILDKISKSGYNNLTKEEKDFLFKMSKK